MRGSIHIVLQLTAILHVSKTKIDLSLLGKFSFLGIGGLEIVRRITLRYELSLSFSLSLSLSFSETTSSNASEEFDEPRTPKWNAEASSTGSNNVETTSEAGNRRDWDNKLP